MQLSNQAYDTTLPILKPNTQQHFITFVYKYLWSQQLRSANGSPIEQCEDGALVATVSKKRRGNGLPEAAMFDINVGGKVISLSDPNAMSSLSNDMKDSVTAQLSVLQDQLSMLMTQIKK